MMRMDRSSMYDSLGAFEEKFNLLLESSRVGSESKDDALKAFDILKEEIYSLVAPDDFTGNGCSHPLLKGKQAIDDAQRDCELLVIQLEQIQEELKRYFLLSQRQSGLLRGSARLQVKCASLLADVAND